MECPSCSSSAVLYDRIRGEQICTRCGFVIFDRLYELEPEWRRRPGEELERADASAGTDVAQHDFGLGTNFNLPKDLSPHQRANLRRMRVLHQRSRIMDWDDRSLREVLIELDKLCEDLALPKGVKAEVSMQYRRARSRKLTAGRDARQILAALILATCRLRGIPRTYGEISKTVSGRFGLKERAILRNIRKLSNLLTRGLGMRLPKISADRYVDRFSPQLKLSRESVIRAHELIGALPRSFVQTKPPLFLAALVVYVGAKSTGEKLTLKEISSVMGVGTSSLSKNVARVKELIHLV